MRKYLLGVLEALGHFCVLAVQGGGQRVLAPLALQIDISDEFLLAGEDDLGLVGEVNLHDLVAEPEHDRVFGLHPLLDVAVAGVRRLVLLDLHLGVRVEVVPEVLQQRHFLLQLTLRRVFAQFVRGYCVRFVPLLLFDVFEVLPVFVHDYFCGIVEVHAR